MAGIWALFRTVGGPSANPGWIRKGHYAGASFVWDTPQIPCPDPLQAYPAGNAYFGYLKVDPFASHLIWVNNFVLVAGAFKNRTYLYDSLANTWTIKADLAYVSGPAFWCCDMVFDEDGAHTYAWMALATDGAVGGAGVSPGQGVYMSTDRGAFTFKGSGIELLHSYTQGNVNAPQSLTSLTIKRGTGGARRLYVSHNSTWAFPGGQTYVISVSADDGATWLDQGGWAGNKFMLESMAVLRYVPGSPYGDGWYVADHSPAGNYSAAASGRVPHDLTGNTWGGFLNPTPASGCLAFPFASNVLRGVAYPTDGVGADTLAYTTDGGNNWTGFTRPVGHRPGIWYRGARTAEGSLDTAGVFLHRADNTSEIWWSEDGGITWASADAEPNADGLSLDFGDFTPDQPQVWPQSFYWADSRGFVGRTRFFVAGDSQADAGAHALAILGLLSPISTARFLAAVGAYNTEPFAPFVGTDAEYNNVEQVLRLEFLTAQRSIVAVEMPCPTEAIFLDDQESLALLNPALAAAIAGIPPERLANRGGQEAVTFIGGSRISRPQRQRHSIRTLNPNETGPSG